MQRAARDDTYPHGPASASCGGFPKADNLAWDDGRVRCGQRMSLAADLWPAAGGCFLGSKIIPPLHALDMPVAMSHRRILLVLVHLHGWGLMPGWRFSAV